MKRLRQVKTAATEIIIYESLVKPVKEPIVKIHLYIRNQAQ